MQSNLFGEEWKALRNLADDRSIVLKGADKCSSVVVWDRDDSSIVNEAIKTNSNFFKKNFCNTKSTEEVKTN